MKKLIFIIACLFVISACATTQLPKDSTFAQKTEAICSDLTATVLFAQIGLTVMQRDNWAYDYSAPQKLLFDADALLKGSCAAAQTETDLLKIRNAVLAYLADASRQQQNPPPWKE